MGGLDELGECCAMDIHVVGGVGENAGPVQVVFSVSDSLLVLGFQSKLGEIVAVPSYSPIVLTFREPRMDSVTAFDLICRIKLPMAAHIVTICFVSQRWAANSG